jgi:serine/threonine-protein kinase
MQQVAALEAQRKLRLRSPWLAWSIAALAVAAAIVLWAPWRNAAPPSSLRFSEELDAGSSIQSDPGAALALSPDGSMLVLVMQKGETGQLYIRRLDRLEVVPLAGTEGASCPFFSPDGQWVAFFAEGKLKKVSITGGSAISLCDTPNGRGGTWTDDGTIIFARTGGMQSLMRVSSAGGKPEPIGKLNEGEVTQRWPQMLPGGKALLYTSHTSGIDFDNANIVVQPLPAGARKVIHRGGYHGRYLPSGHLVYVHDGTLFAARFDLDRLEMIGQPVPVLERISCLTRSGGVQLAASNNGTMVYLPGASVSANPQRTLAWVDRNGKEEALATQPDAYGALKISPDGLRVALVMGPIGVGDIWIWDLARKTMSRLTFEKLGAFGPLWTADSKKIVYTAIREKVAVVCLRAADGTGKEEIIGPGQARVLSLPSSWSADGNHLIVTTLGRTTAQQNTDIGLLSISGDRKYRPLLQEVHAEGQPQVSRDGRWMAYSSDESGRPQIYVRPFPNVDGGKWQVSTGGGNSPLWSPNGSELFYRNGDEIVAVPVKTGSAFSAETPKILFRGKYAPALGLNRQPWDISPDGRRFLMVKPPDSAGDASGTAGPRKINIVLNWLDELKQRVPVK